MRPILATKLGLFTALFGASEAQFSNWDAQQINTSICTWNQPRAALVRDTIYLDGGTIWWRPGLSSGTYATPVSEGNYKGYILAYNLSKPFTKDSNVTGLLLEDLMSKARGGTVNGISTEPNYYDGGMLANDAEFFLYGGAVFRNDQLYDLPPADAVLGYRRFAYGPEKPLWQRGFSGGHLDDGVNRYVAYGAAANAPSENMAWYFSGMTSPTRGPIIFNTGTNGSTRAMNLSNTLVSLDMQTQLDEHWSNTTLPDSVRPRANAEVVWVPVGKRGILAVLGGVIYPEWATAAHKSENETASKLQSQEFMRTIDIYDVDSQKWYQQPTTSHDGGPGPKTRGCAVVAPASDYSSFNIYYYGGFDGTHPASDFSDEVWVLSLPSFTWTLVNEGNVVHGRSGHKCFSPYPDQMMVFGGYTPLKGDSITCLDQGPVVIFNLTSGEWMDSYSPAKYADYGVQATVRSVIGGTASGGSSISSPMPSGWATRELGDIFSIAYDRQKLKRYWPYASASSGTVDSSTSRKRALLPVLLPAILVPVALCVGIGVGFWYGCLGRKKKSPVAESSDSTTDDNGRKIVSWIRGHRTSTQPTVVTESPMTAITPSLISGEGSGSASQALAKPSPVYYEMEDTQVSELCGASSPAELYGTDMPASTKGTQSSSPTFGPSSRLSKIPRHQTQWSVGNISQLSGSSQGDIPWVESPITGYFQYRPDRDRPPGGSTGAVSPDRDQPKSSEQTPLDTPAPLSAPSVKSGKDNISAGPVVSPLQEVITEGSDTSRPNIVESKDI